MENYCSVISKKIEKEKSKENSLWKNRNRSIEFKMSAGSTETGSSCDRSVTPGTIEMNSDCSLCDMPDSLRRNVCNILDRQDAWIHVAREMEFSNDDIDVSKFFVRKMKRILSF